RVLPRFGVLMLQGDAGRVADVTVLVVEVRPYCLDRLLVGLVIRLEGAAQFTLLRAGVVALARGRRFLADVADAVQPRLRLAPADREVHRPVHGVDDYVRQRQWRAAEELLQFALVARALRRQVDRVELAVAPVTDEERLLILRRELRAVAERDSRRRTWADVDNGAETVGVVGR